MAEGKSAFLQHLKTSAGDTPEREAVRKVLRELHTQSQSLKQSYSNYDLCRKRAAYFRWRALNELDSFLIDFESSFTKRGGKLHWSQNATEVGQHISSILKKRNSSSLLHTKLASESELNLTGYFKQYKITAYHGQLGSLSSDKKDIFTHPAFSQLPGGKKKAYTNLTQELELKEKPSSEAIRQRYINKLFDLQGKSDVLLTEASYLVADKALVAIAEDDGSYGLLAARAKVVIALVPIERLVARLHDLSLLLSLEWSNAKGAIFPANLHLLSAPLANGTTVEGQELHVILFDNDRSTLLKNHEQRSAVGCIKCGACHNVSPEFEYSSGFQPSSRYSGPLGQVLNPHLEGFGKSGYQSDAALLCGRSDDVCPVQIPLRRLLLLNRRDAKKLHGAASWSEKFYIYLWKKLVLKREQMNNSKSSTKRMLVESLLKKGFGIYSQQKNLSRVSFNEYWREKHNIGKEQKS